VEGAFEGAVEIHRRTKTSKLPRVVEKFVLCNMLTAWRLHECIGDFQRPNVRDMCRRKYQNFSGIIYDRQLRITIGQMVEDLESIARAVSQGEWRGRIEYPPIG